MKIIMMMLLVTLAGCGKDDSSSPGAACTAKKVAGISTKIALLDVADNNVSAQNEPPSVAVVDAVSGESITDADSDPNSDMMLTNDRWHYLGVWERQGHFNLTITHRKSGSVTLENIEVTGDRCHPKTTELSIKLKK